ncbi:MAG TPA: FAD-dependent oxidoreductase [Roseiflexaceae bacterium]|nr:FAD-dependent oxidoreductase [Roseiflexaceae bacterium]
MKTRLMVLCGLIALVAGLFGPAAPRASAQTNYTIIIYGAGFSGIAAALNAYDGYRGLSGGVNPRILLINNQSALGGLGTVNGQNFMDWNLWQANGNSSVHEGSFRKFVNGGGTTSAPQFDRFYSTGELANWFASQISARSASITLLQPYDLRSVARDTGGRITSVTVQKLKRENQAWLFDPAFGQETYTAPVFIDASENGRLTTMAGATVNTGRQDRPSDRRQMVATLMFRARGIDYTQTVGKPGWSSLTDKNGTVGLVGGNEEINTAATVTDPANPLYPLGLFNRSNTRFQIKGMNVAEDRASTTTAPASQLNRVYWFNTLLIVGVDGLCERKYGCADTYTYSDGSTAWSTDYAFAQARSLLLSTQFRDAMRAFPGFSQFQVETIVVNNTTYASAGESLYIRETVHTPKNLAAALDGTNYGLTIDQMAGAGSTTVNGTDWLHYDYRVGLGFYNFDSNGYTKNNPSTGKLDNDPKPKPDSPNPSYIPIGALLTSQVPNLILAGYSASVSNWAWTAIRVLPNQAVIGDAAGMLAAYAVNYTADPLAFGSNLTWITNVRNRIKLQGGRVDKCVPVTTSCAK